VPDRAELSIEVSVLDSRCSDVESFADLWADVFHKSQAFAAKAVKTKTDDEWTAFETSRKEHYAAQRLADLRGDARLNGVDALQTKSAVVAHLASLDLAAAKREETELRDVWRSSISKIVDSLRKTCVGGTSSDSQSQRADDEECLGDGDDDAVADSAHNISAYIASCGDMFKNVEFTPGEFYAVPLPVKLAESAMEFWRPACAAAQATSFIMHQYAYGIMDEGREYIQFKMPKLKGGEAPLQALGRCKSVYVKDDPIAFKALKLYLPGIVVVTPAGVASPGRKYIGAVPAGKCVIGDEELSHLQFWICPTAEMVRPCALQTSYGWMVKVTRSQAEIDMLPPKATGKEHKPAKEANLKRNTTTVQITGMEPLTSIKLDVSYLDWSLEIDPDDLKAGFGLDLPNGTIHIHHMRSQIFPPACIWRLRGKT
jgi:hypothetical protein